MKKSIQICVIALSYFLGSCSYTPNYISHYQKVSLADMQIGNANFIYDNKTYTSSDTIELERTGDEKKLIIKKTGFQDYIYKFNNVWSDELWANGGSLFPTNPSGKMSAGFLFLPGNTLEKIGMVGGGIITSFSGESAGIGLIFAGVLGLIPSVCVDAYNIVIGAPSTLLVNPWKKYELDSNPIVLQPTKELADFCHAKEKFFITNIGCIECTYPVDMLSSESECNRCLNRMWDKKDSKCKIQ